MFATSPKNRQISSGLNGAEVLPLFSEAAAARIPVTGGIDLSLNRADTGLPNTPTAFVFNNNLFVGSISGASTTIGTSPDGYDWTARTMPLSRSWRVGGAEGAFVAVGAGTTDSATSADGASWVSGGALPAAANTVGNNLPIENGGNWVVYTATTSLAHSVNGGTSWTTQTLPATPGVSYFLKVGGLFWYWVSGTTAYTSPTGLTGSWTVRTLPVTPNTSMMWQDPGTDSISIGTAAGADVYRTVDGITWTNTNIKAAISGVPYFKVNGVYFSLDSSSNPSFTLHGEYRGRHWSSASGFQSTRLAVNNRGVVLVPVSANVMVIDKTKLFGLYV